MQHVPPGTLSSGMTCWLTPPMNYWGLHHDLHSLYSITKYKAHKYNYHSFLSSSPVLGNWNHSDACILALVISYALLVYNKCDILFMCVWTDGRMGLQTEQGLKKYTIFAHLLACKLFVAITAGSEWQAGTAPCRKTGRTHFPTFTPLLLHQSSQYWPISFQTPVFTAQYFDADWNCLL